MFRYLHLPCPYSCRIRREGIRCVRNKREAKALYKFCLDRLADDHATLSIERQEIFRHTMDLYKYSLQYPHIDSLVVRCGCGRCDGVFLPWTFYEYVDEHAGAYWHLN